MVFQIKEGFVLNAMYGIASEGALRMLRDAIDKTLLLTENDIKALGSFAPSQENDQKATKEKQYLMGFIYIMIDDSLKAYKVGWSMNPLVREGTLQAEKPTIRLLEKFPGTIKDEKEIHKSLALYKMRGEWFNTSLEEIKSVILKETSKHGKQF